MKNTGSALLPRAVMFDYDGVLVNSEPIHRMAWAQIFRARGVCVSEADFAWSVGRRDITFAERIVTKFRLSEEPETIRNEKRAVYLRMLQTKVRAFEGIPELLRHLGSSRPLGLVTSSMLGEVEVGLDNLGLREHFDTLVTSEDVQQHKPHPEPYLLCAQRLCVAPADCVAFEDSPSGIRAAKAAGMRVVALTTTFARAELAEADEIIEGVADTAAVVALLESLTAPSNQM